MDIKFLKDINKVKSYLQDISNSLNAEVAQIKKVNKENFLAAFNIYVVDYLKKNYLKFDGRVSRRQYWMFFLYTVLLYAALELLVTIFSILGGLVGLLELILSAALIVPHIGLAVRRLHDINLSGVWALLASLCVIRYVGFFAGLFLLFLLAIPSDKGANNYGKTEK